MCLCIYLFVYRHTTNLSKTLSEIIGLWNVTPILEECTIILYAILNVTLKCEKLYRHRNSKFCTLQKLKEHIE